MPRIDTTEDAPAGAAPMSATLPLEAEVRTTDLRPDDAIAGAGGPQGPDSAREARIRQAAYAAYVRRGRQPGHEEEDWLEAERQIDAEDGLRPDGAP